MGERKDSPAPNLRPGLVPWEQIERYRFEGDLLILTGTDSILKGGPVKGGVFHLRRDARSQLEPILEQHLAQSNPSANPEVA